MTKTKAQKAAATKNKQSARGKNKEISNGFTAGTSKSSGETIRSARFKNNSDGSSEVVHEEYVRDIFTSSNSGFKLDRFQVNPGILTSFPWLSSIAANYESYRFRRLEFVFKTSMPTTASGFVAMTPDSDPTEESPTDKTIQLQMEHTSRGPVWNNRVLRIPVRTFLDRYKEYYVRSGPVNNQGVVDLKLYDSCSLYVSTEQVTLPGLANTAVNIGELWVRYVVDLLHPQLISATIREQNNPNAVKISVQYSDQGTNGYGNAPLSMIPSNSEAFSTTVTQDVLGLGGYGQVVYDPGNSQEVRNYAAQSGPASVGDRDICSIELPSAIPEGVLIQGILYLSCDQVTGSAVWQPGWGIWETTPTNPSYVANAVIGGVTNVRGWDEISNYKTLVYFTVQRKPNSEPNTPIRLNLANTLLTTATERVRGWQLVLNVLPGSNYTLFF